MISIYIAYHATYTVLHSLVDMKMTCFNLIKVASDGDFHLLFGENYQHLATAKFDP